LIALIAKARSFFHGPPIGNRRPERSYGFEKTSFASNASGSLSGQAPSSRLVAKGPNDDAHLKSRISLSARPFLKARHPALDRMRFLFTMSDIERP